MRNKSVVFLAAIVWLLTCCSTGVEQWNKVGSIQLEKVAPIGIATAGTDQFWISDGDHNRLLKIDLEGNIIETIDSLERPMHIETFQNKVYVPTYGSDEVWQLSEDSKVLYQIDEKLDAPAAVTFEGFKMAVADFYGNSVLFRNKDVWQRIGGKGQTNGKFHYPTDVQFHNDKLYVADAYNHRVQVFDKNGGHLLTFGEDEDMNAATGLYVHDREVLVTDFENDRVLSYDVNGVFQYAIEGQFDKPTDMIVVEGKLYVLNYGSGQIDVFEH